MGLGYDIDDRERSYEADGITGTVTRYTKGKIEYPCYIVSAPFESYKITVLRAMFQKVEQYDEDESNMAINLYFEKDGSMVGLGKIFPRQVNSFLRLFQTNKVTGFYDSDTELVGDRLYVLSN